MSFNLLVGYFLAFLLPATVGALLVQALGIGGVKKSFEPAFIKSVALASFITAVIVVVLPLDNVSGFVIGILLGAVIEIIRSSMAEKESTPYRIAQVKKRQMK